MRIMGPSKCEVKINGFNNGYGKEVRKMSETVATDEALTEEALKLETAKWELLTESKLVRMMEENPDSVALGGVGVTVRPLPEKASLTEKAQSEMVQKNRERSPSKIKKYVLVDGVKVRVK